MPSTSPASRLFRRARRTSFRRQQQKDLDELGPDLTKRFATFSPGIGEMLKDAPVRKADVLFDREYTIDLGGVSVKLLALGSTHTPGDTMVFVEQDRVLYAGDVVMNKVPVAFGQTSSVPVWVNVLKQLEPLRPTAIVPAHGPVGDGSLIAQQRRGVRDASGRAWLNSRLRGRPPTKPRRR